jgi:four helix bundle protein
LLKSGTSIGANIHEAQNAESRADFIHKVRLQQKKLKKQNTGSYYAKGQDTLLMRVLNLKLTNWD